MPKYLNLPREGLYIDPLAQILRKTLLNPIPGLLLWLYTQSNPSSPLTSLSEPAKWATILGLILLANDSLTFWSRNNWVSDCWGGEKEIVVVTGGAGGIGASVACRLGREGVRVVVVDVVPLTYDIAGMKIVYYKCDLSDEIEVKNISDRIRREVGNPTVLINNAGLCRGQPISQGSYHDNSITLRTNLLAPFLLTKEFLPDMIKHDHGHIFTISSMSAYIPPAGVADYAASKAGLIASHESLGLELKHTHKTPRVRTSLAVLSFIKTPLFKGETNQARFLTPLMHVDTVGDAIVDTLYSGYARTIYLPGIMRFLAGIRGAPEWVQMGIRGESQKLRVDFRGRQTVDSKTGKIAS
ncbi:hypothetical protein ASPWEDRAFT_118976 [Aspergillus wentii DTO 134E9]|uniref:NAD(P)-binding protein n=1 Tax=Aspergillus wentii DTO 134E9 TaxID=1073089 RepID=A0A1L9R7X7_ASPWE|nr:uncharacterized protein ASPWEDRAFT_118976 [Aspergillus wentii DTO 134E9]KAI9927610.1 hypothetical protein MW887_003230 [Aspergillus wentii]OJJ30987.1 hypothetical protein ASPWEDRAFT_118976 [Aspergillus wentii DTO 134E9]